MYYRLLENENWAEEAQKIKEKLRVFIKKKRNLIEFNEDWEFNMVHGVLYSKPIRAMFRLKRYIKNISNQNFIF